MRNAIIRKSLIAIATAALIPMSLSCGENAEVRQAIAWSRLPEYFDANGVRYKGGSRIEDTKTIDKFYAYFVNEKDLEKWKKYDNDESLFYIVDTTNYIVSDSAEEMKDRVKVYTIKDSVNLAAETITCYVEFVPISKEVSNAN